TCLLPQALEFASEQAPYTKRRFSAVCDQHPEPVAADPGPDMGVRAVPAAAVDVQQAVQATLQFACNFVTGNNQNKGLLWDCCFPRMLMELLHRLKSNRCLLLYVVVLVHGCVITELETEGSSHSENGGGRQRLEQLIADRAFCCLLMQVFDAGRESGQEAEGVPPRASRMGMGGRHEEVHQADPAAEWLYLLFGCFVSARLVGEVYEAVGIRIGSQVRDRGVETMGRDNGEGSYSQTELESCEQGREQEKEEDDFFFPVTPEQLILLSMVKVVSGEEGDFT
ncbi:unnamed protein product, partial [Choristocarpus tenellus]